MEFYAASKGNIKPADMEMFGKIQVVLDVMPNMVFDPKERGWDVCKNQVSCHLICRALSKYFDATVKDGYFFKGYQHSWLIPKSGSSIIDAYPVAGAAPFIVARDPASPWVRFYNESNELQEKFAQDSFIDKLEKTTQVIGETIQKLGFV